MAPGLGERIKFHRMKLGIGPDELAERSGISRTAIHGIESGKTDSPRARTLRDIAKALGVGYDELVGPGPTRRVEVDPGVTEGGDEVTTFVHSGRHYELRSHPVSAGRPIEQPLDLGLGPGLARWPPLP